MHRTPSLRYNVLTMVVVGAFLFTACSGDKSQPAGPGAGQGAPAVTVVSVRTEAVPLTSELPGRTAPYLIAELRPQVGGIVKQRLFTEGSEVKAGQVLYQIDPATYQPRTTAPGRTSRAPRRTCMRRG